MRKGFTLIELIVVIAIIATLAAIIAPNAFKAIEKGRVSATIGDWKSIKTGAMAYYADTGRWPRSGYGSTAGEFPRVGLITDDGMTGWDGPYLENWPATNAWGGTCYWYTPSTTGNRAYVYFYGASSTAGPSIDEKLDDGDGSRVGTARYSGRTVWIVVSE